MNYPILSQTTGGNTEQGHSKSNTNIFKSSFGMHQQWDNRTVLQKDLK